MALAGCNTVKNIQKRERLSQLEAEVNTYRKVMRWGHYEQAAQYRKNRDGSPVEQPDFARMARYKVSSYTIADQIVADTEFDAKVTAYIEFYEIETSVAAAVREDQYWWYDEDTKRWYLGSPITNFARSPAP